MGRVGEGVDKCRIGDQLMEENRRNNVDGKWDTGKEARLGHESGSRRSKSEEGGGQVNQAERTICGTGWRSCEKMMD